jgi:hypothetical protein
VCVDYMTWLQIFTRVEEEIRLGATWGEPPSRALPDEGGA